MERWQGDYVAPFGHAKVLAKKPTAWVVGMGWTPAPIVSFDAEARTYKDHTEARVGMSLNYMFGVPIADQLRPAAVAELTTIDGSRHDFVQRQNEIILEYRATPGRYRILVRKGANSNTFVLTILDGFGNIVTGLPVRITG
jgi:adhesin/invasin